MRINFFDRKISTLLGFIIITIGLVVTIFLVKAGTIFEIGAGPGQDPKNIEITNISDVSFSLSYTTDDKVIGTLKYGTTQENLDKIALDDRDQLNQSVNSYKAHSITVKDLDAKTTYYFSITSGDEEFFNNGELFKIQTGDTTEETPSFQKPISGRVITPSGQAPEEGLVFVTINGAAKLSTLLKTNGTYVVPLNNLRNDSFNNYFKIEDNMLINIEVISENLFSSVSVSPNQISPVPLTTLSNNYDFSSDELTPTARNLSNEERVFPTIRSKKRVVSFSPTRSPAPTIAITNTPIPLASTPAPSLSPTGNSSVIITTVMAAISAVAGIFSFLSD